MKILATNMYNPLPDINRIIGKEYDRIDRIKRELEKHDYDVIYYDDYYIHIVDAMDSDDVRYIYQLKHNRNGSVCIEKFVEKDNI